MKKSQFNPATYIIELNNSLTTIITEITRKVLFSVEISKNWDEIIIWQKRKLVVLRRILNTDWGTFSNTAIANKIIRRAEHEFEKMKRANMDSLEKLQECRIYRPDEAWLDGPVMVN